jgi:uncharacterized protein (DUF885 family)
VTDAMSLADEYWDYYRATAQFTNIDRGDVEQIASWEDFSPGGVTERIRRLGEFAERAEQIPPSKLTDRERTTMAALSFSARSTAVLLPIERDLSYVAGPYNIVTILAVMVPGYALTSTEHGAGYVAKLHSLPQFVDGWIEGLRDGVADGRVATSRGLSSTIDQLDALLATSLEDDPLVSQVPPSESSPAEADSWRAEVRTAVDDSVRPALTVFRSFLHDELLPSGRPDERAGICHLPNGSSTYQALLRAATSTDLTADQIHQLGLDQLSKLDVEYHQLGPSAVGLDDPLHIRDRLRTDTSLRYATASEIVIDATASLGRAVAAAPQWFNRLPRSDCTAAAVNTGPAAYYTPPSPDGVRGGRFFFNTATPSMWTAFSLQVTTFHESVPGHHLQLALALEFDLHPILRELFVPSYGEGWALYSERLADEMGLYASPLQRLGMLAADSLRAARLVVDTGLHAFGWTREAAVDFLVGRSALQRTAAEAEIDRYIAMPGQATSYMIGRLEIERLRRHAETSLGEFFSIAAFHDVVLGSGMTPLPELTRAVNRWIAAA